MSEIKTEDIYQFDTNNKKEDSKQIEITPEDLLPQKHPINKAVTNFLHRIRDIEDCATTYVPLSYKKQIKDIEGLKEDLKKFNILDDELNEIEEVKAAIRTVRKIERLHFSEPYKVLQNSLFIGLFSAYDSFTGDLLASIFIKKPELYSSLNKTLSITDILRHESFDQLKEDILRKEIEDFRRKSYVEQFEHLENLFGLKLKDFGTWPDFVECTQRRNLLTHCDGVVSKQYLNICKKEGVTCNEQLSVGSRLSVGPKYLLTSCDILAEVGFKLAQTVWRKLFPEELSDADELFCEVSYEWLLLEKWNRAKVCGQFAMNQKRLSSDMSNKILVINYAIACKYLDEPEEVDKIISSIDWSASLDDFKLAVAVIKEDFNSATKIMRKIGEKGELVSEHSYHTWPLFRSFREFEGFLSAYEEIYGHKFIKELQKEAEVAQTEASQKISSESDAFKQELIEPNDGQS